MRIKEADPRLVVTMFSSVKVVRDHPTKALTPVELENYVSQAAWKFFNQSRATAAQRLEAGEMELDTTDVRVVGIKIDGHQVINPTGFTGRQLEIVLSVSMSREKFSTQEAPVEGAAVRAYMMLALDGSSKAYYIEVGEELTTVFAMDDGSIRHISSFDWGRKDIISLIEDSFEIEERYIWPVYERYAQAQMSEKLSRKFDKVFFDSLMSFENALSMIVRNEGILKKLDNPPVYVHAHFDLPDKIFRKRFNFDTKKHLTLQKVEEKLDIEEFLTEGMNEIHEELNEVARRRIKWATPTS